MWSFEIERLLNYNYSFIGCYPHDTLPHIKRKSNISIIINTANSKRIGEHWVAMKMTNDKCFYFDSFGVEIINENIKKFAKIYKNVIYSARCIQNQNPSRKLSNFPLTLRGSFGGRGGGLRHKVPSSIGMNMKPGE